MTEAEKKEPEPEKKEPEKEPEKKEEAPIVPVKSPRLEEKKPEPEEEVEDEEPLKVEQSNLTKRVLGLKKTVRELQEEKARLERELTIEDEPPEPKEPKLSVDEVASQVFARLEAKMEEKAWRKQEEEEYEAVKANPTYLKNKDKFDSFAKKNPKVSWRDLFGLVGESIETRSSGSPGYRPNPKTEESPKEPDDRQKQVLSISERILGRQVERKGRFANVRAREDR